MNSVKKLLIGSALSLAVVLPTMSHAQAATKIGFVNTERILRDSKFAVESQKKLERDFSKRQKELEDLATKVKAEATVDGQLVCSGDLMFSMMD